MSILKKKQEPLGYYAYLKNIFNTVQNIDRYDM